MSRILTKKSNHVVFTKRPYVCVKIETTSYRPPTLTILPDILFLKTGTSLLRVPEDIIIQSQDGEKILPSGAFWMTSETIDPYHLLLDILDDNQPF